MINDGTLYQFIETGEKVYALRFRTVFVSYKHEYAALLLLKEGHLILEPNSSWKAELQGPVTISSIYELTFAHWYV